MAQVLLKSASFVFLILLGYVLKKLGVFSQTDYKIFPKIILNITLPCAVITSFASYEADPSLLLAVAVGFAFNWVGLGIAFVISKKKAHSPRAIWLNCLSGYNIGAFALPFVQSFLSPVGVVAACMMDTGNAIMCTGGTYSLVSGILQGKGGLTIKQILKKLLHSTTFMTYIVMLLITFFGIRIPQGLVNFIQPAANANPFLAMFMVGLMFDVNLDASCVGDIFGILAARFALAVGAACVCYFLLPVELPVRQALCLTTFAPVSVASTALCEQLGGDRKALACLNSLTIAVSIPCMLLLLALFGAL